MHPQRNLIEVAQRIAENSQSAGPDDYDFEAAHEAHQNALRSDSHLEKLSAHREEGQKAFNQQMLKLQNQLYTSITPSDPRWDTSVHGPRLLPALGKHNQRAAGIQHGTGKPIGVMVNSALIRNPDSDHIPGQLEQLNKRAQQHYAQHPATAREDELHREHNPLSFHAENAGHELIEVGRAVAKRRMDKMKPHQLMPSITGPRRGALGEGEIDDTIARHFKEFNAHPTHGGTVPMSRFRSHVLDYVRERRD